MGHLVRQHQDWFLRGGLDYEIGLTGSKLQAAAAAIVAAVLPVNQVWYVQPKHFDETHFSSGVGVTRHFRVAQAKGLYVRQQERPQMGWRCLGGRRHHRVINGGLSSCGD